MLRFIQFLYKSQMLELGFRIKMYFLNIGNLETIQTTYL